MTQNLLISLASQLFGEPPKRRTRRYARATSTKETIGIDWRWIRGEADEKWEWMGVLYALVHPTHDGIIYLGKADYSTVRQRYRCARKDWIHDAISLQGFSKPRILVGELMIEAGRNFRSEKLADVESLLIQRLQPIANLSCRTTRIKRPGLTVECVGRWPLSRRCFRDKPR